MRHLVLVIALLGAGLQAADAADSPAQMVVGERSIEELLRIPDTLKPGRYSVHCGVKVGTSGWTLFVRCYSMTDSAPDELQTAVMHATRTSLFVPATRDGKPVDVFVMLAVTVDTTLGEPLILAVLIMALAVMLAASLLVTSAIVAGARQRVAWPKAVVARSKAMAVSRNGTASPSE